MQSRSCRRLLFVAVGLLLAALSFPLTGGERGPAAAAGPVLRAERRVDFAREVQPILAASCYACHGPRKQKGDLRLDVKSSVLRSGAIVPGKSGDSLLIQRVSSTEPDQRMPPKGPALKPEQVALLRAWIDQGAAWPERASAHEDDGKNHWAYRPLAAPALPAVQQTSWVRNPIDAFVLARLEEKGLKPAPPADRRTLIRRVTFDLIGLPPTPEEIDAFLNDPAPNAYEKVVDRLLSSPHYGERWARHWMDVIHFAETHGHDQDVPRENAWPYRDYLIRAFNADRPYRRFLEEQLAGDVLFPDDPQAISALGFIAAGPWDESSQRDIRDDTLDKKIAQNLDRDDMVTTALSTFASTSVHCARCHNHKFDPISQDDYYALQAVFAGIDRANRPYDPDPRTAHLRHTLRQRQQELQGSATALSRLLLAPKAQAEVAAWEKARGQVRTWTVLAPSTVTSTRGATPIKQADHSVRFTGSRPEVDTYVVEARTDRKRITGIRLEVLTDEGLPHHGPGRQDNGNLHLTELRVQAAPAARPTAKQTLTLQNPSADFNQEGWSVALAIDGNPRTAWGIYPEVGKSHAAVFEIKEPAGFDGGTILTFTLEQNHGGGHLIGRLRLSVTDAPHPLRPELLPPAISRILALPAAKRSDTDRAELALHVLRSKVEAELAALPPQQMVYAGASDFKPEGSFRPARGCRPVFVLRRGDVNSPGAVAAPGALTCVPGLEGRFKLPDPGNEGSRRAALARWLSHPNNVLTWRSIVNRVWHYHFGQGIVATPNDFGRMGARPTHPELLDYLAVWLRDHGGSLKQLHRLIVTSAAYTQSSRHDPACARVDASNLYLWRMNRTRLDAESLRDAVLQITGKIDRRMGGPSDKHFLQGPGIHRTPSVDYLAFDVDNPAGCRRSVYRFLFRTLPDPFMDALDCPDASQFTPVRSSSVTALQALALLNDRFMVRQSEHFAARVGTGSLGEQIDRAYLLALGRPPTAKEQKLLTNYAMKHGMANVCRLLLNTNEFLFVP